MDDLARLRLQIGDPSSAASPLFADDELGVLLAERSGNVLLAAADACDILATRFAGDYDFDSTARQRFMRSQRSAGYAARARVLRERAGSGLNVIPTTKVDGFSDDLSSRDGSGGATRSGRVLAGYTDPDLPV